jgi:SPP1 gp7 family putative phage head morphogenesis protein
MLTKEETDTLIEGILAGIISISQLPLYLYEAIFKQLETSLVKGMNVKQLKKIAPKKTLDIFLKMSNNLRHFSAAKTYQMIKEISKLTDKDEMLKKYTLYAKTYQKVENDTVVKQSQTVNDFVKYENQKDVMPYLRYVTVGDERVRPIHADMDGIVKKVDDPFWDDFIPQNGYNCRCTVEQVEKATESQLSSSKTKELNEGVIDQFKNNPAKTGIIFKEKGEGKHPYFDIPEKDKKNVSKLI